MKSFLTISLILLAVTAAASTADNVSLPDTCQETVADTLSVPKSGNWVRQLIENGFHINDPGINYPRFARFCLKVYNWGDRTFNSYDSAYVVPTGKNWKFILRNDNSMNSYLMVFPERQFVRIYSEPNFDLGGSLNFMAVSLSYAVNAKTLFTHTLKKRNQLNFSFTCSLFSISLHNSQNEGGARIRQFCDYEPVRHHSMPFNDVRTQSFYIDGYYFFNHRRYSQAAAYCFSKYQLRSAGSWLAGFTYTTQNFHMDFSGLPADMLATLPVDQTKFDFHYRDYCLSGGYAYNWVLKPRRWLINVTALPSIGYRKALDDATEGRPALFSSNIRGRFAIVYNAGSVFAALSGDYLSHVYFTPHYTFFNNHGTVSAIVGVRF